MLGSLVVLAAEGADQINPVLPDNTGEIFWGAVSFFGLWILMRYWLLPPLLRIRSQRQEQEIADLEAASAAEQQAEQVRRDYEATLGEARSQANGVLEAARSAAEEERSSKVAAAEREVAARRQVAIAELDEARSQALGRLGGDVAELAVSAASKVVDAPLDVDAHRGEVQSYVEGLR